MEKNLARLCREDKVSGRESGNNGGVRRGKRGDGKERVWWVMKILIKGSGVSANSTDRFDRNRSQGLQIVREWGVDKKKKKGRRKWACVREWRQKRLIKGVIGSIEEETKREKNKRKRKGGG
jgi:hypothetical protein